MTAEPNPFAALSLIVAPAIMTNACTVLIMSTSNRLARTADRAREHSREIEAPEEVPEDVAARRSRDLDTAERRQGFRIAYTRIKWRRAVTYTRPSAS